MNRLTEIVDQIDQQSQPPVHLWKPEHEGDIDIRIDANGVWFHEGEPILRDKLVRLFASILWCEHGQHFLVTPAEKLAITVEDAPYVMQQMEHVDDAWVAITNTHEQVIIGESHPVELRQYQGQWVPYVNIRYDLWGRVNRSIYFQWVSDAMDDDGLTLSSQGYVFAVAKP